MRSSLHTEGYGSSLMWLTEAVVCLKATSWVPLSTSTYSGFLWYYRQWYYQLTPIGCHFLDHRTFFGHNSDSCTVSPLFQNWFSMTKNYANAQLTDTESATVTDCQRQSVNVGNRKSGCLLKGTARCPRLLAIHCTQIVIIFPWHYNHFPWLSWPMMLFSITFHAQKMVLLNSMTLHDLGTPCM